MLPPRFVSLLLYLSPSFFFERAKKSTRIASLLNKSEPRVSTISPMASAPNSGVPKAQQESEDIQSTADMTAFVQNLLMQMQSRFQAMSESIVSKIDEMGGRIDELEHSINDLKAEMGADTTPAKSRPEEAKPDSAE